MYDQFLTNDQVITLKAKMPDGSEHDTHWKKCPHFYFERLQAHERSGDVAQIERAKQMFIAASLVNPDGTRALTEKQSIQLTSEGVVALFPLAMQANNLVQRPDPKGDSPDGGESM